MKEIKYKRVKKMSEEATLNTILTPILKKNSDPHAIRDHLLNELTSILSINEAAALVARISEKKSKIGKGKRFGLYPIEDWSSYGRLKRLEASFWLSSEVEFKDDRNDFMELTEEQQRPLLMAFGFFAVGDGTVASALAFQMIITADNAERQAFYIAQLDNERIHGESYARMIYTLVRDPKQRDEIFTAVENVASIGGMNKFIERAYTFPKGRAQLFVTIAAAEFVMFVPLFCIIFWYRAYMPNKMKQVIFLNELIARDEGAHCINGCDNYNALPVEERYEDKEIFVIFENVVKLVSAFADEVLSTVTLTELTPTNVKQYVCFIADEVLVRLGHPKYYHVENPFIWMDYANYIIKANFYESKVGEYSRFNVKNAMAEAKQLCEGGEEEKKKINVYRDPDRVKF